MQLISMPVVSPDNENQFLKASIDIKKLHFIDKNKQNIVV
jgi:hypothetical protein